MGVVTGFDTGKEHGGAAAVVTHASLGQSVTDFSTLATSACTYSLRRYVITLDSMPTASAHTATKTLLYKSPVGSCNVAKRRKVRSRAMNVPIVVHAMERVDCAPAT